ncbi:MAG: type II toxin-antitoxin system HicA family toxin [Candidatus Xenobia bacterium]
MKKIRDAIATVTADGWYQVSCEGSHRQFKHPVKRGRVTINGKPGDDCGPFLWNSIMKQAGLK